MNPDPPQTIEIDLNQDTIALFGVVYALDLFRGIGFGGLPIGTRIEIVKRKDGVVTLKTLTPAALPTQGGA